MTRSARVTLTVVAAVSCGAQAQQAPNPCGPSSFNQKACQTAVKRNGYCSGGAWVTQQYQQYPYYYDLYRAYSAAGGAVSPAAAERCGRGGHGWFGGFGAHGRAHASAGA